MSVQLELKYGYTKLRAMRSRAMRSTDTIHRYFSTNLHLSHRLLEQEILDAGTL
jgi:hypothetical protein